MGLTYPIAPTQAQFSGWSSPIALSPDGAFGWFPDILADSSGKLHVVWPAGSPGYDQVLYTFSQDGLTWKIPNDIAAVKTNPGESASTRPSILIDSTGLMHVSFEDIHLYYSNAPALLADSALSWRKPSQLSGKQAAYFSRLATNSHGDIYIVYSENLPTASCSNCYHLNFRKSTDHGASWSAPIDISGGFSGSAKPQILVDATDAIHVVYEGGSGGGLGQLGDPTTVNYTVSNDGGNTFTAPIQFKSDQSEMSKNITIGADGLGKIVVAWWSLPEDKIYFQVSGDEGRNWNYPQAIPATWGIWSVYQSRLDDYAMATDSSGTIHLVAVVRLSADDKSLSLVDLMWNSQSWSKPEVITTLKGDVPEWPRIAISQGNQLNVVWFERDQANIFNSDHGHYRIWYASRLAESREIPASPVPTVAPLLKSTLNEATPNATGQETNPGLVEKTTEATLSPALRIPTNGSYSESDYLKLMGKALIPSGGLLIVVILVVYIRRRFI